VHESLAAADAFVQRHVSSPFMLRVVCGCCCMLAEQELDALDVRCLEASVWVSPMGLFSRTCHLADHLNVELPHVAGEALILREVQELGLPQVMLEPLAHMEKGLNSCLDLPCQAGKEAYAWVALLFNRAQLSALPLLCP
jgi:hypothetical protein